MNLPTDVQNLLKSALDKDIDDYSITIQSGNNKGDGFLGEVIFLTIQNKITKENKHWVVKRIIQFNKSMDSTARNCYLNEIKFYTKIWTNFIELQKSVPDMEVFDKIAACYAVSSAKGEEKLLLENLKFSNFEIFDKTQPFDKEHMELVFKTYGQFHGISFASRELNPEKYFSLAEGSPNILVEFVEAGLMNNTHYFFQLYLEHNIVNNNKLKLILEDYAKNANDIFVNVNQVNGENGILIHGDCWSNNMMFKYDGSQKPIDIRLIDFQLVKRGTPVFDLSYCFYASGYGELFKDLDYYLKIYHDSLSATLEKYGLNSEKIYPFDSLKNEWKLYAKFGVIMGMYLWTIKVEGEHQIKDINENLEMDNGGEEAKIYYQQFFEIPKYNEFINVLILHAFEHGLF